MIVYPNAKLNLGLFVTGRRADGYHLLETAFLPIPLVDTLELELQPESGADRLQLEGAVGADLGAVEDNLVLRAVRSLRELAPIPAVSLRLEKQIPSGAGMGGGSADASFTLTALRELTGCALTDAELERVALTLGADCPVFIANRPAVARGIGEVLSPLELPQLEGCWLTVVKPQLHISTAEAFRGLLPIAPKGYSIEEVLAASLEEWRERLVNDFEPSLFPRHPELAALKAALYAAGADFALLTGSGAALYALSAQPLQLDLSPWPACFHWQTRL